MKSLPASQRGFALVAAIFLIVILAALALFAVRIASTQQQSLNLELLEARALAAANSGLEYGANLALQPVHTCNASTSMNLTEKSLTGFKVTVTCTQSTPVINGTMYYVSELKAVATNGTYGYPDYVARTTWRTVSNIP